MAGLRVCMAHASGGPAARGIGPAAAPAGSRTVGTSRSAYTPPGLFHAFAFPLRNWPGASAPGAFSVLIAISELLRPGALKRAYGHRTRRCTMLESTRWNPVFGSGGAG